MIGPQAAPTGTRRDPVGRRWALVARFAVLHPSGAAHRHEPEPSFSPDAGSAGKIILASQGYARRLAAALLALGESPQVEYLCRQGHWHLKNADRDLAYREGRRG